MYLAYSALSANADLKPTAQNFPAEPENESVLRYMAYQETCNKFKDEIAAIRKYIPGWMPAFR